MKHKMVHIDSTHAIPVDYFDFTVPPPEEIDAYKTSVATLYFLASFFKNPFYQSLGMINRNNLPWRASIYNKPLGYLSAFATFPSWAMGALFEGCGLWISGKAIRYHQARHFNPKADGKPFNHASHNIAFPPEVVSNDSHLDLAKNRLPLLIQSIRKAAETIDFYCLQEAFCYSEDIIKAVSDLYGFALDQVAQDACILNSGLVVLSKFPIIECRFIKPPLPLFTPIESEDDYSEFLVEALTNKGILMVVVKNGDHFDLVINAHLKSESSHDPKIQKKIEKLRAEALMIIMQEMHHYIDELKARGIFIRNVHFAGDTNASDVEETGQKFNQRSQHSTFFEHVFPGEAKPTWAGGFNGYRKRNDVTFDHVGVFYNSQGNITEKQYEKTITVHPNETTAFGPISDHDRLEHIFTQKGGRSLHSGEEFSSPGFKSVVPQTNVGKLKLV